MTTTASPPVVPPDSHVPVPPSERRAWLLACAVGVLGVAVLVAVLTGSVGESTAARTVAPPTVLLTAATPTPGVSSAASVLAGGQSQSQRQRQSQSTAHVPAAPVRGRSRTPIVARPNSVQQRVDASRFVASTQTHI